MTFCFHSFIPQFTTKKETYISLLTCIQQGKMTLSANAAVCRLGHLSFFFAYGSHWPTGNAPSVRAHSSCALLLLVGEVHSPSDCACSELAL
uniref:Uncharacterized protein n=1 Tax=Sinocyclocheilus anshuiensis TaxID=1608454 RepID=A0A671N7A9_9TELE